MPPRKRSLVEPSSAKKVLANKKRRMTEVGGTDVEMNFEKLRDLLAKLVNRLADKVAYLDATSGAYFKAPEFGAIQKRKRVKSHSTARAEVRKDVIRALVGMARPAIPNSRHS